MVKSIIDRKWCHNVNNSERGCRLMSVSNRYYEEKWKCARRECFPCSIKVSRLYRLVSFRWFQWYVALIINTQKCSQVFVFLWNRRTQANGLPDSKPSPLPMVIRNIRNTCKCVAGIWGGNKHLKEGKKVGGTSNYTNTSPLRQLLKSRTEEDLFS